MTDPRPSLTHRQREIYEFVLGSRELPPTVREIADRFGFGSHNGAMCHIKALVKKGYVRQPRGAKTRYVAISLAGRCPTCGAAADELLAVCKSVLKCIETAEDEADYAQKVTGCFRQLVGAILRYESTQAVREAIGD